MPFSFPFLPPKVDCSGKMDTLELIEELVCVGGEDGSLTLIWLMLLIDVASILKLPLMSGMVPSDSQEPGMLETESECGGEKSFMPQVGLHSMM